MLRRLRRYPDSRILARCPSLPILGQWLRAAPRIQWRDRAGLTPASPRKRTHRHFPKGVAFLLRNSKVMRKPRSFLRWCAADAWRVRCARATGTANIGEPRRGAAGRNVGAVVRRRHLRHRRRLEDRRGFRLHRRAASKAAAARRRFEQRRLGSHPRVAAEPSSSGFPRKSA